MKPGTDIYKTVLAMVVGLSLLSLLFRIPWLLKASLLAGLVCALSGWVAEKTAWLWTRLSRVISMIMPNILLSVVFFALLTPIALLSRLFGTKDPLMLRNRRNSTFRPREKSYPRESFEKMW